MKDENKAIKAIEKAENVGNSEDGDKPSASSIVERADAAAERLAKENERMEANIRRQEELMAKKALGGESHGPGKPDTKKELSAKEYKDYFLKHGHPPEGYD